MKRIPACLTAVLLLCASTRCEAQKAVFGAHTGVELWRGNTFTALEGRVIIPAPVWGKTLFYRHRMGPFWTWEVSAGHSYYRQRYYNTDYSQYLAQRNKTTAILLEFAFDRVLGEWGTGTARPLRWYTGVTMGYRHESYDNMGWFRNDFGENIGQDFLDSDERLMLGGRVTLMGAISARYGVQARMALSGDLSGLNKRVENKFLAARDLLWGTSFTVGVYRSFR